jgi:hypothetical protein
VFVVFFYKDLAFVLVVSGAGFASMVKNEGGNAERDSSDASKGRAGSASGATGADPSSPSTSDEEGGAGSKQSTEDGDDDEPDSKRRYLSEFGSMASEFLTCFNKQQDLRWMN